MKRVLFWGILQLIIQGAGAQSVAVMQSNLQKLPMDTTRVKLLKKLGEYYLYKPGEVKIDLDSALNYLNEARSLSIKLRQPQLEFDCIKLIGNVFSESGRPQKGYAFLLSAIGYYHTSENFLKEAALWISIGDLFNNNEPNNHISREIKCYQNACDLYLKLKNTEDYFSALGRIAKVYIRAGKIDQGSELFYK
nr:hypothetical protein [Mucilaginibacter sp. L294]